MEFDMSNVVPPEYTAALQIPSDKLEENMKSAIVQNGDLLPKLKFFEWAACRAPPAVFYEKLKQELGQNVCGVVWAANEIAYKCRTCEMDPTCAICMTCFQNGNHDGHDYSMIRTGGGCCDCGDAEAWARDGFCSEHSGISENDDLVAKLPSEFKTRMGSVLRVVLQLLIDSLRKTTVAKTLAQWLIDLASVNDAVCAYVGLVMVQSKANDNKALISTLILSDIKFDKDLSEVMHRLYFKLLVDPNFKKEFTRHFIRNYSEFITIMADTLKSDDSEFPVIDNFSVQLFTVPSFMPIMVQEESLLLILINSLESMFRRAVKMDGKLDFYHVALKNKVFWRPSCDVRHVLSIARCAQMAVYDFPEIFEAWVRVVAILQYCNPIIRKRGAHVEVESDSWTTAFTAEIEIMQALFLFMTGLRCGEHKVTSDTTSADLMKFEYGETSVNLLSKFHTVIGIVILALHKWFSSAGLRVDNTLVPPMVPYDIMSEPMSFHLPLQRTLAGVLSVCTHTFSMTLDQLLTAENMQEVAVALSEETIRMHAFLAQIRANYWVRNGQNMAQQAALYRLPYCSHYGLDMDLYNLQAAAIMLGGDHLFSIMVQKFGAGPFFSADASSALVDESRIAILAEDLMSTVLMIITDRVRSGFSPNDTIRAQIIHRLILDDLTHSNLQKSFQKITIENIPFESILAEVADFIEPSSMQQGLYRLKDSCYEEFNPYYSHYSKRELQQAEERWMERRKSRELPPMLPLPKYTNPDKAFKDLRVLLRSQVLLSMCLVVLRNAVAGIRSTYFLVSRVLHILYLGSEVLVDDDGSPTSFRGATHWGSQPFATDSRIFLELCNSSLVNDSAKDTILSSLVKLQSTSEHPEIKAMVNTVFKSMSRDPSVEKVILELAPQYAQDMEDERKKKMEAAKRRQNAIMARFQGAQNQFNFDDLSDEEEYDDAMETEGGASGPCWRQQKDLECALCHEKSTPSSDRAVCMVALLQKTSLVHNCRMQSYAPAPESCDADMSGPDPSSSDTDGTTGKGKGKGKLIVGKGEQDEFMEKMVTNSHEKSALSSTGRLEDGMNILHCGHYVHPECARRYSETLKRRNQSRSIFDAENDMLLAIEMGEFYCPFCRRLANILIPVVPDDHVKAIRDSIDSVEQFTRAESLDDDHTSVVDYLRRLVDANPVSGNLVSVMEGTRSAPALSELNEAMKEMSALVGRRLVNEKLPEDFAPDQHVGFTLSNLAAGTISSTEVMTRSKDICTRYSIYNQRMYIFSALVRSALCLQRNMSGGQRIRSFVRSHILRTILGDTAHILEPWVGSADTDMDDVMDVEGESSQRPGSAPTLTGSLKDSLEGAGMIVREVGQILMGAPISATSRDGAETARASRMDLPKEAVDSIRKNLSYFTLGTYKLPADVRDQAHGSPLLSLDLFNVLVRLYCVWPVEMSEEVLGELIRVLFVGRLQQSIMEADKRVDSEKTSVSIERLPSYARLSVFNSKLLADGKEQANQLFNSPKTVVTVPMEMVSGVYDEIVEDFIKPFMRRCAMFLCVITAKAIPVSSESNELEQLSSYLELPSIDAAWASGDGEAVFQWFGKWAVQMARVCDEWGQTCQDIVRKVTGTAPFRLIDLPKMYQDLFKTYAQVKCRHCGTKPKEGGVCLLCGAFVCMDGKCCRNDFFKDEAYQHALECGAGIGAYLFTTANVVLLLRENRRSKFPSPYLDNHGEEDPQFRRGRPLFLSRKRYEGLVDILVNQTMDHDSKILASTYRSELAEAVFMRRRMQLMADGGQTDDSDDGSDDIVA